MAALQSSVATLTTKAPDELEAYRQLVMGLAKAVADAKGGEKPVEVSMMAEIGQALGAGQG